MSFCKLFPYVPSLTVSNLSICKQVARTYLDNLSSVTLFDKPSVLMRILFLALLSVLIMMSILNVCKFMLSISSASRLISTSHTSYAHTPQ